VSSDNYYIIRKHPKGGFAAVMGFASDDTDPVARDSDRRFDSIESAFVYGTHEYSEYGVSLHPECEEGKATNVVNVTNFGSPDLSWVDQVQTVYALDSDAVNALNENAGWRLIATGVGPEGQTTLTYGWPWED
jgi:hypothetical protein